MTTTHLKDLSIGDKFSFPTSLGISVVTGRVGDMLFFQTVDGLFPVGSEVDVNTGEGRVFIPDYMLWHIHIGETLTRKEYTQEEKDEARKTKFPLFVNIIK